jgi:membrane associated rhomboid family serine protease
MAAFWAMLRRLELATSGYFSPMVTILIGINTIIYLASLATITAGRPLIEALVADERTWSGQIWRPLTGAFLHFDQDPGHWFWNMLLFFFCGHVVERQLGAKGLALFAVIIGTLANILHLTIFGTAVLGFSGVVIATVVAFACIAPKAQVIFIIVRMPAWVFATIIVGLDLLRMLSFQPSGTAYDVHLAGALFGYLAIAGRPWLSRFKKARNQAKVERQAAKEEKDEAELDRLLAKVSSEGLPALSESERRFLQRYSNQQQSD